MKKILIAALLVVQCQSGKNVDEKTGRATDARSDSRSGFYYDDMARYLAGFDLPQQSSMAQLAATPEYAEHKRLMATFWTKVREHNIAPVAAWREASLNLNPNGPVCRDDQAAFYPMSGADIINLYTICPRASEYIMIAYETAGDLPHPEHQTSAYYRGLKAMRHVIQHIAERNFFLSKFLITDLMKNAEVPGIAPVLLAFGSGLGWHIVSMEKIYLAPDGQAQAITDPALDFKPRGIRIWFRTDDDKRLRSLTYIEQFIKSESVAPEYPLAKFLAQKRGAMMMMKAAVYLMHMPKYRAVREFFLTIPDTVVQDDSGFRYVDMLPTFDVSIYGLFSKPYPLKDLKFQTPPQPELRNLYAERKPPKLPFNFGYGTYRTPPESNIIVAHRKKA